MKIRILFLFLLMLCLFASSHVCAADNPTYGVKFISGAAAFLDEETPLDHFVIGLAGVIGLNPRLRIEPQFLYMNGPESDRDITLTGNISYDLHYTQKAAFYVVAGGGLLRHTQDFKQGSFSNYEGTVSGGIGMRFDVTQNFYVAPEFRIGWEPLIQIVGAAGFKF